MYIDQFISDLLIVSIPLLSTLVNMDFWAQRCHTFFTGLPVAQLSYKMSSVFPSGTNRTLACSARAQDIRVCVE